MKKILLIAGILLSQYIMAQPAVQWSKVYGGHTSDYRMYAIDSTGDGGYIEAGGYAYGYNVEYPTGKNDSTDAVLMKFDADGKVVWQKRYGGTETDVFNSVRRTSDGGFIAAGFTGDTYNYSQFFVVKTNASGEMLWQTTLPGNSNSYFKSVIQTADGNYIATGCLQLFDQKIKMYVAKFNTSGDTLWTKTYDNQYYSDFIYANNIRQTTDGGYIVAGQADQFDNTVTPLGDLDALLVKLDAQGNKEWSKQFGGSASDNAAAVRQTTDGGYIFAGSSASADGDVTGNHGSYDIWLVKTNATGTIQWQQSYGGPQSDGGQDISITPDGNYIVAGYAYSASGDVTGHHGPVTTNDAWVLKINSTGGIIWQNCIGGINNENGRAILPTATSYVMAGLNDGKNFNSGGYLSFDYWLVNLNSSGGIVWQTIDGASGGLNAARSVEPTTDGGFITAGYANSDNDSITGNHGSYDGWIVKTSSGGAIQWSKTYGGLNSDIFTTIKSTTDGGYIVAGNTTSIDGDVTASKGNSDLWLVKLTSAGAIQWQKTFGGTGFDSATAVQPTADGGYIIAGNTTSTDGDVSGNHGGADYWIIKTDASGNLTWQKTYGGTGDDYAYSVKQTTDGGYIVCGKSASANGNVTGNHGGYDFWVLKLDASGSLTWQKSYGGTLEDDGYSIIQTADGGYLAGGSTKSPDGDVTGLHNASQLVSDFWILKLTAAGDITWEKTLGGSNNEQAYEVVQTSDNGYVAAGGSGSYLPVDASDGDVTGNHGYQDGWITKISSAGELVWQKSLGGISIDYLVSVKQTSDGGFIAAGATSSHDGDISNNPGSTNYWLVKLASGVLPVTLLTFEGTIQNNMAVLQWATASEINNKGFNLQKSADGITFTTIGFVRGTGNTGLGHQYKYDDTKLYSGQNYYRLAQVDVDGHITYSPTIQLEYSKFAWHIYGNPAGSNTQVQFQLDRQATVTIQLLSVNGAVLQVINKRTLSSGTYSIPLNTDGLPAGIYLAKLIVNNKTYSRKIVK